MRITGLRTLYRTACILMVLCMFPCAVRAAEILPPYPLLPTGYSSITVFDYQKRYVGRILPEKRYWTPINRIPVFLQRAVVAVEDSRFYEHNGIDLRGIARAVVKDVVKGKLAEGGSTITQQLIKNRYLTAHKTIDRKVKEGFMAIEFEKKYTKRQILEMYLNEIYYGNGAWGIAQAARIYFDKLPEELNEAECTVLAGVPKSPGRYNPLGKPEDVGQRKTVVLKRMEEVGAISPRQLQTIRSQSAAPFPLNKAPYYLSLIRGKLLDMYGPTIIDQGGLEIIAALDLPLQLAGEAAVKAGARRLSPTMEAALVCFDVTNGNLLAAVGGTDFKTSPYNRALVAKRQPGSAMKPLIYAAAFEQGLQESSTLVDSPITYPHGVGNTAWTPQNYDGKHHGTLTLRRALATSNNIIAVKLLEKISVPTAVAYSRRVGLTPPDRPGLSYALGTDEVTLHDLTKAYIPFAAEGMQPGIRTLISIRQRHDNLYREQPVTTDQPVSPYIASAVTSVLKDVLNYGTAKNLKRFQAANPSAGKTGTTNDYRDAWFIGYTPRLVTGVWVGYDQPRSGGRGFTGGAAAAPIWEQFMRTAVKGYPGGSFKEIAPPSEHQLPKPVVPILP